MIKDVEETLWTLKKVNMKLNPKKCSFKMEEGKFFRYIVTFEGIRANPEKTKAVVNIPSPSNLKQIQRLSSKLAALNRFLFKAAKRALPCLDTLKKCTNKKDFHWTTEAEEAFEMVWTCGLLWMSALEVCSGEYVDATFFSFGGSELVRGASSSNGLHPHLSSPSVFRCVKLHNIAYVVLVCYGLNASWSNLFADHTTILAVEDSGLLAPTPDKVICDFDLVRSFDLPEHASVAQGGFCLFSLKDFPFVLVINLLYFPLDVVEDALAQEAASDCTRVDDDSVEFSHEGGDYFSTIVVVVDGGDGGLKGCLDPRFVKPRSPKTPILSVRNEVGNCVCKRYGMSFDLVRSFDLVQIFDLVWSFDLPRHASVAQGGFCLFLLKDFPFVLVSNLLYSLLDVVEDVLAQGAEGFRVDDDGVEFSPKGVNYFPTMGDETKKDKCSIFLLLFIICLVLMLMDRASYGCWSCFRTRHTKGELTKVYEHSTQSIGELTDFKSGLMQQGAGLDELKHDLSIEESVAHKCKNAIIENEHEITSLCGANIEPNKADPEEVADLDLDQLPTSASIVLVSSIVPISSLSHKTFSHTLVPNVLKVNKMTKSSVPSGASFVLLS
ncbi:hypothetical protein Tco_0613076 [Tanacetum coccineum]